MVWERMCFARSPDPVKAFTQPSCKHLKGFSPVWVRVWVARWPDREKAFPHPSSKHLKGFSPVWVSVWVARWLDRVKAFPHPSCLHLHRFPTHSLHSLKRLLPCTHVSTSRTEALSFHPLWPTRLRAN